jgi:hypothetical protein
MGDSVERGDLAALLSSSLEVRLGFRVFGGFW